jgi:UDP-N-acetylmuramoyl-tripeptide--D-alanyl-D-alanine ligase
VLNADDRRVAALAVSFPGRVITFGLGPGADFRALEIRGGEGGGSFTLSSPLGTRDISLPLPGEHNVRNALAAAAAAFALGAGLDVIGEGLAAVRPVPMRFALHSYLDGIRVVNDAYNANPDSMESALRSLKMMQSRGRHAAVLGDMLELGEESPGAHRRLGKEAAAASLDLLVAVGRFAEETVRGAVEAGLPRERIVVVPDCRGAAEALGAWLGPGDLVLLKGSRGVALEEVLGLLESEGILREN